MAPRKPSPEQLDRKAELEEIYAGLKREFERPDSSSAKAALGQRMIACLAEIDKVGKGDSAGSGIDELAGRRAAKKTAKRAPRKSKAPAKTAARKAASRRKGKK